MNKNSLIFLVIVAVLATAVAITALVLGRSPEEMESIFGALVAVVGGAAVLVFFLEMA